MVEDPIQMVDLKKQYLRNKVAIDEAIHHCIDQSTFIKGPQVTQFERALAAYLWAEEVIACANGTDALQLAMMALDLRPGDEVIVPAFTYVATAEVIALLGLIPVMVDVDPVTFTITAQEIEKALSRKTRAVVPVHLFGQCAEMEPILQLCRSHQIYVIEDNAQAIGAHYTFSDGEVKSAGCLGDLGTTSFFPSKNLGCFGDGGAVYTNDTDLGERVRKIANHGQSQKYKHDLIGVNSRLDTLQAVILLEKLKLLDDYTAARQWAAAWYDQALADISKIEIPARASSSTHVYHQYTLKVPARDRDGLKAFLQQKQIPSMVYYPIPLAKQKAYQDLGRIVGDLAVTEELCQRVISLPMHTELSEMQLEYICQTVDDYFIDP
ncbi:DegT/DnrJ/EryC1/StrS family aminotransferase [Larkinella bovis]|uniref:DegT/DnrJ/EryC1/StrS family aminotransferase n=1 Tax=Larkinella bovis TaxID=683041 RepID=A0ABW0II69_9BACT